MKVLIIGASGFLGGTIYYKLKKSGVDVLGTYSKHKKQDELVKLDVMDTESLTRIMEGYAPDVIIWTVMNHSAEEEIADKVMPTLCDVVGDARLIFVSTSVAYEKNMSEDVTPFLRTEESYNYHYFNGKIKSENIIRKMANYCIVRPGSIYGINPYGEMDIRSLKLKEYVDSGKQYVRANNIIFSIVEVNELAEAIIELAGSDYIGIMNVSEDDPISHYDFNKSLCKRYGWDDSCVVANEETENIYFFDNSLRKRLLKTKITSCFGR
ncbi:dTDP-4-dehydrorhamnose reductase [Butyrivibrio sp. ob235]|uniref:NAD-dependent epimerase/dehydratase family protein n=1 Tax=Butyrivibrio sp. ob235 TaxID=1761780 RepID=UPI0008ABEED1|nr:NAD-dependent epimerase/dehydratase family protein [Butyrivibrio sp. ob235]SEM44364.1 dTDP-4-dehydrorhamnose reductase [Butyrivibrio sp. ob235]